MKTLAFALIAIFLLSGCVVRVVEPTGHAYGYSSKQTQHYQKRKKTDQKPVLLKVVHRDVVHNTYIVKKDRADKRVQTNHRLERKTNKKVRRTRKALKVKDRSEGKNKY